MFSPFTRVFLLIIFNIAFMMLGTLVVASVFLLYGMANGLVGDGTGMAGLVVLGVAFIATTVLTPAYLVAAYFVTKWLRRFKFISNRGIISETDHRRDFIISIIIIFALQIFTAIL